METTELLRENAELRNKLEEAEKMLRNQQQSMASRTHCSRLLLPSRADRALQIEIAERKRMEKALRESEYRYRSLFDQMSEGFALCEVVFDSENEPGDLRVLEVNSALEQLSGFRRAELIGKTIRQALPKAQLGWIKTCGRVGLDGAPVHFERYSDSFKRHFEVSAYSPASGTVACLFRDITHRKRAEAALSEIQERLQLALDSTELGTFDFEPQTGRLVWSKFAWHHFDLPPGARASLETFLRAIHPEDRPRMERVLADVLKPENNGLYAAEYRTIGLADRKERWISAQGRVFFDTEGRPLRFLGVILDITQRKRMEQERYGLLSEFQRQRSLLAAILNQMPIGVTVAESPSGRILLTNNASGHIFGSGINYEHGLECYQQLSASDQHGQPFPAKDWPLARAIKSRESVVDKEIRIRLPDGSSRVLSASAAPVIDHEGKMVAGVSLTADITERVRMQEALRESREELEQKVAQRTEELSRVNQILRMISQCDQALVQATDEKKLIQTICRLIYKVGIYRTVGVGFAENDENKTIRPITVVETKSALLDRLKVSWGDNEYGRGPAGTAIRTGRVYIARDYLVETNLAPWRELAMEMGIRSSIALPLMDGSRAFGVLTLYAACHSIFDETQATLLKELADNLSFGIISLRARKERDEALKHLEQKTSQLRALASELTRAEELERRRLAQLLHDDLQQCLVGARFQLSRLLHPSKIKTAPEEVKRTDQILRECLEKTRSLTAELRPRVLFEPDFGAALKWLGERFQEKHGLHVKVAMLNPVTIHSEEMRVTLFQAVRELLFNAVKHAKVKTANVRLTRKDGHIRITVSDQGVGFDLAKTREKEGTLGGFGLLHLQERIASLGELEINAAPGRGCRFTITVREDGMEQPR